MRILLFGIYRIGDESLARLLEGGTAPAAVVTMPGAQAVADRAASAGLPVLRPLSPAKPAFLREVLRIAPDLLVVAGYPRILPPGLLGLAPRGGLNLHLSLLPKYRGPCPWKWSIACGERRTGATVHRLCDRVDAGDVLAQEETPIGPEETGGELFDRLSRLGAGLLARTLADLEKEPPAARPQSERHATYFGAPTEVDARIDWSLRAERIRDRVRGFWPRPGAWAEWGGRRVRLSRARVLPAASGGTPGTLLSAVDGLLRVSTGSSDVEVVCGSASDVAPAA